MREHDVAALTAAELQRGRRELTASVALTWPGSPALIPILARLTAIDIELTRRACQPPRDCPDGEQFEEADLDVLLAWLLPVDVVCR